MVPSARRAFKAEVHPGEASVNRTDRLRRADGAAAGRGRARARRGPAREAPLTRRGAGLF